MILRLIRELADHVRQHAAVRTTAETLRAQLAGESPPFECLVVERWDVKAEPVGFALFFRTYSTWLGCEGMWLEHLCVTPSARGKEAGTLMLRHLARICVDRGFGRFEWNTRDFDQGATRFFWGLGARPVEKTTTFRVAGDELSQLASGA